MFCFVYDNSNLDTLDTLQYLTRSDTEITTP